MLDRILRLIYDDNTLKVALGDKSNQKGGKG